MDATRALTRDQIAALWRLDVPLRDKTLWRMLYETAARAGEILGLDAGDMGLPGKRARLLSKGGMTDWVHWQTGAAILLPRLLAGRRAGPVFLTSRPPARWPPQTYARSPAGPGCPTAVPPSCSSSPPGAWRRRGNPPRRPPALSSAGCMAGPCTSSATLSPLCFRVAIAAISGKRTCDLRCSTTFSSLPLVAEPHETGQSQHGQANCDTGTTEHGECGNKTFDAHPRSRERH